MMKLKTKTTKDKCAASRCSQAPVEVHHLDEDLHFCAKHAEAAIKEYGEDPPVVTKLQEVTPGEIDGKKLEADRVELEDALKLVKEFEIEAQEDVAFAEESRDLTKDQWKDYEEQRTEATKPLNKGLKVINGWFKPVQNVLKSIELEWNKKLKEHRVRQQEEQQRLIEAARAAEDPEEIKEALVAAAEAPIQTQQTTFVDRWVFSIEEASKIPREYLMPDEKKIGGVVSAMKDATNIPGVKTWNDPIVRSSTRRAS